jgi:hypothetical protein
MHLDEIAIVHCALDYFEGWFDGDPERMRRALHPALAKRAPDGDSLEETTTQEMIELTTAGAGKRFPGGRRIDVQVVDVYGTIATAVVDSDVYREYIHLVRTDDGWKIVNALYTFT